jgi:hypothetical protein
MGSFLAGYTFVYVNEKFLKHFFNKNNNYDYLNWKMKLLLSYICGDIAKAIVFLPFEARKQRIQMYHNFADLKLSLMSKFMLRGFIPMMIRDVLFRIISFGSFVQFLNVEHKPALKYKLQDINIYIRQKQKRGEPVDNSVFLDHSKFQIKSSFNSIFTNLVFCTILATFVTHPLDVITTKILTQTRLKYRGIISTYNTVIEEEGIKKLFMSGLGVRCSFNVLSSMSVLMFFDKLVNYFKELD